MENSETSFENRSPNSQNSGIRRGSKELMLSLTVEWLEYDRDKDKLSDFTEIKVDLPRKNDVYKPESKTLFLLVESTCLVARATENEAVLTTEDWGTWKVQAAKELNCPSKIKAIHDELIPMNNSQRDGVFSTNSLMPEEGRRNPKESPLKALADESWFEAMQEVTGYQSSYKRYGCYVDLPEGKRPLSPASTPIEAPKSLEKMKKGRCDVLLSRSNDLVSHVLNCFKTRHNVLLLCCVQDSKSLQVTMLGTTRQKITFEEDGQYHGRKTSFLAMQGNKPCGYLLYRSRILAAGKFLCSGPLNFEDEAGPSSPLRPIQVMDSEEQHNAAEVLVAISRPRGLSIPGPIQSQPQQPTQGTDPKDKGKGILVEEPKKKKMTLQQIRALETTNDEEVARKIQAEWDAEEERKRIRKRREMLKGKENRDAKKTLKEKEDDKTEEQPSKKPKLRTETIDELRNYLRVVDFEKSHILLQPLSLTLLGDLNNNWETAESSDDDFRRIKKMEIIRLSCKDHRMEVEDETETAITLIHLFILWTTEDGDNS
ncbi:putative reverse transcriptase domain-containing protein [Tanacetum coccineum]